MWNRVDPNIARFCRRPPGDDARSPLSTSRQHLSHHDPPIPYTDSGNPKAIVGLTEGDQSAHPFDGSAMIVPRSLRLIEDLLDAHAQRSAAWLGPFDLIAFGEAEQCAADRCEDRDRSAALVDVLGIDERQGELLGGRLDLEPDLEFMVTTLGGTCLTSTTSARSISAANCIFPGKALSGSASRRRSSRSASSSDMMIFGRSVIG